MTTDRRSPAPLSDASAHGVADIPSSEQMPSSAVRVGRRSLLWGAALGAAWLAAAPHSTLASGRQRSRSARRRAYGLSPSYVVGVGSSSDGYVATQRAIAASGQWPSARMAGQTVVIKPNLVAGKPATSGATTDPQVVRAVVDVALAAGAARVLIVEAGAYGIPPNFGPCGYSFFATYDPRVQLVDLGSQALTPSPVPNGLTYQSLVLPAMVVDPSTVFISVAKLKCHVDAVATLSMKNLFGLAPPSRYAVPQHLPRFDLHARGVDEAVVDLNLARPVHFAVIDGIWGMEGNGPLSGTPIQMNVVLAGLNPLAVDRTALSLMQIPQHLVPHLAYAAYLNLGPADMSTIRVVGDVVSPQPFVRAQTPPVVLFPKAYPPSFAPRANQTTTLAYRLLEASSTRLEVITDSEATPGITVIRTLHAWTPRAAGVETVQWDGRDDSGTIVPAGRYLARVQACYSTNAIINYATGPVSVQ